MAVYVGTTVKVIDEEAILEWFYDGLNLAEECHFPIGRLCQNWQLQGLELLKCSSASDKQAHTSYHRSMVSSFVCFINTIR